MISNSFKGAYTNAVSQQNQGISTIAGGVKDIATIAIGAMGAMGALGSGVASTASQHTLAGRIGGVGGNIMLATLQEKKESQKQAQKNQQITSNININAENKNTVFETLQMAKESGIINNKGNIDSSMGDIDPQSELGKKILGGMDK